MQSFKPNATRFGVVAVILATPLVSACRQEVRFTQTPPFVTNETLSDSKLSSMFVPVPLHLDEVVRQAEQVVPQSLKRIVAWPDNAACFMVKKYRRCEGARTDLYLTRDGAVKLSFEDNRLNLILAFNYVMKARGLGPARHLRATTSGKLQAVVGLDVALGRALAPSVAMSKKIVWSQPTLSVLSGEFDVSRHVSGRVKKLLRPVIAVLTQELQNTSLRAAVQKVWRVMHAPIKLGSGANVWLIAMPRFITDGGFTYINGRPFYRVAIASQMAIINSSFEPQSQLVKRLPRFGRLKTEVQNSIVQVQVNVEYDGLLQALKRTWPAPIEMDGGVSGKPMRVTVNEVELYPSNELLALGLDLDVKTPDRAFDLTGKAYLTAEPVFDATTSELRLANVTIAKTNAILGIGPGTGKRLRLSSAPFLTGIKQSVKLSVAAPLSQVFDATNALVNRDIGDGLWLHGRFDKLTMGTVHPQRAGLDLVVDLLGELAITQGTVPALSASAAPQKPSAKPVIGG